MPLAGESLYWGRAKDRTQETISNIGGCIDLLYKVTRPKVDKKFSDEKVYKEVPLGPC